MTVEQLIKKLQKLPHQDAEILVDDNYNGWDLCNSISDIITRKEIEIEAEYDDCYEARHILENSEAENFYYLSHFYGN